MSSLKNRLFTLVGVTILSVLGGPFVSSLHADPCGMVPPIFTGPVSPIARTGLQKTYVFHKDGVETFVIRPGFTGNVDNFGMLIPFPTPPELRKVPDNVFEQIANAIDPPEVVIDLRMRLAPMAMRADSAKGMAVMESAAASDSEVQVLKEEAVGMYEVAVLAAGSADALKKWMDKKGYQYPEGMDTVTTDYIKLGWCFVAVKTKVGKKSDANPRPGRRRAKPEMPSGGTFDGFVQGMGFRFKSEELVVPMRLSAFNDGDLRNIVYLLTDGPRKIRSIPEEYVVRQLSGQQLYDNVTKPLPLRIIGGTEKDIPEYQRRGLPQRRDPVPHNGVAKDLFASDLLAVSTGNLSLAHEEMEKQLLSIGEYFGLRGPEADAANSTALKDMRDQSTQDGLEMLKTMTLTVVDGDFPRQVIASQNLTFAEYKMPQSRNNPLNYDSNLFGPGKKKEGTLKVGMIDWDDVERQISVDHTRARTVTGSLLGFVLMGVIALCFKRRPAVILITLIALGMITNYATAQDKLNDNTSNEDLVAMLSDSKSAKPAIAALVKRSKLNERKYMQLVRMLVKVAKSGEQDLPTRGWAIAALSEIGGLEVDEMLLDIHADKKQEKLVRTWAAAARVSMSRSVNALVEKAQLVSEFPSLGRPIGLRLIDKMKDEGEESNVESVLAVSMSVPQLQSSLAPAVIAFGPEKLSMTMLSAKDNQVRRLAAGYLGTAAQGNSPAVAKVIHELLQFDPEAKTIPWEGGALFVPGMQWGKEDARILVGGLIRWYLWCELNGRKKEQSQLHNNLRSLGLARAAGYQSPGWRETGLMGWLEAWGAAVGKKEIEAILTQQNVQDQPKYATLLNSMD